MKLLNFIKNNHYNFIFQNKFYESLLKKKIKLVFISLIFIIYGCKSNNELIKKPEIIPPLHILYKSAYDAFNNGDWQTSLERFQKVETRYSYTEWAPKASMMIMYIYYEVSDYYKTLEYARKFKKTYPVSKYIDYIDYIVALSFYEQIGTVARDQTYTKASLDEFKKILKNYPNSSYAEDAKFKIDLINEQLAGKEMYIARFYIKKSKWISAIKRLDNIVNNYNTTIFIEEALHRLVEIYYNLGNVELAKKYAVILGYNFNDSNWYKKSYKIVGNKDYRIEEKKQKIKLKDRVKKIFSFSNDK